MTEKSREELLEEEATALLEEAAASDGVILRDWGVINRHRARRINEHETAFSDVWPSIKPSRIREDADVEEDQ